MNEVLQNIVISVQTLGRLFMQMVQNQHHTASESLLQSCTYPQLTPSSSPLTTTWSFSGPKEITESYFVSNKEIFLIM